MLPTTEKVSSIKLYKTMDTAIKLKPDFAEAYNNRVQLLLHLSQWEKAKADLNTAKEMGIDLVASFHTDYESVAEL